MLYAAIRDYKLFVKQLNYIKMKVQVRIPANVTGKKEQNFCYNVNNIFSFLKVWLKAKKNKASAVFIFLDRKEALNK